MAVETRFTIVYFTLSASVVAFWVPHAEVSHGAGGEAHAYLSDVIALQEDEELGPTFDAAVILRASFTAFGARWWPLSANPSLPSRLGELESFAVTHGAEEDHCQRHHSQLHSLCCLSGYAGSPPATRWIRWGGPLPLWDRWIPLLLGQIIPPLSPLVFLSFCLSLLFLPSASLYLSL